MTRFNEAQMNGNYAFNDALTASQRMGRSLRRPPQLPQKPRLTPKCYLFAYLCEQSLLPGLSRRAGYAILICTKWPRDTENILKLPEEQPYV
ncbi:unnamed protein product [Litomosoides sigmodontis]|uniref:Uncharacterized protein n=1 Tax=Litomosoides sigmodontis TaxID=42156 RepID=A0A3P6S9C7_LITSI|nr:unnamed protein product [Litomosoides sigmodontis]